MVLASFASAWVGAGTIPELLTLLTIALALWLLWRGRVGAARAHRRTLVARQAQAEAKAREEEAEAYTRLQRAQERGVRNREGERMRVAREEEGARKAQRARDEEDTATQVAFASINCVEHIT